MGGTVGGGRSGRGKGGTIHGLGGGGLVVRLRLGLLLRGSLDGLAGGGKDEGAKGEDVREFSHRSKIIYCPRIKRIERNLYYQSKKTENDSKKTIDGRTRRWH